MGGVALEVTIEGAFALGPGQFVVGFGEVVHADVDITGRRQPFAGGLQDVQLGLGRRQLVGVDAPLGLEALRQVGVVEHRQPVRAEGQDLVQGAGEARHALEGQPIDEIDADGAETLRPRRLQHRQGLGLGLDAVHRLLHLGLEVLHPQAHAVEAQPPQQGHALGVRLPRVDLDGVLANLVVRQVEPAPGLVHQLAHLVLADEGRGAAAPVELIHPPAPVEEGALHLQLAVNPVQIGLGQAAVLGRHLVAGAVEADRVAEGDMEIERQGPAGLVAPRAGRPVLRRAETIVKLHRRRIGGVAGAALVVAADQVQVKVDTLVNGHQCPPSQRPDHGDGSR